MVTNNKNSNRDNGSLRTLVVDDSPMYQKLATRVLESHGHLVALAKSGREAIETIQSHDFDVVLMDVEMPEMNGLEATLWIRTQLHETGTDLPIIGVTSIPDPDRCLAAGMDAYVRKPYQPGDLLTTIARVMHEHDRRKQSTSARRREQATPSIALQCSL